MDRIQLRRRVLLFALALTLTACSATPGDSVDLGESVYRMIVGGVVIGEATLLRFYVWHIVGLILPMAAIIAWHGFRVRRDGGISHRERVDQLPEGPRIDREQLVRTETIAFFLTLAVLVVLSTFVNAPIGNPPDQALAADEIKAPWIFWWVQELLRVWPPAIAGVLVPAIVTTLIVALPFIDRTDDGIAVWFNRQGRLAQIIFVVVAAAIIGLTVRAAFR
jgi:quinol-cytochrome oxidoreductase complex cytochrome b subunit